MADTNFTGAVFSKNGFKFGNESTTPTDSTIRKIYVKSDDKAYYWDGTSEVDIAQSGGSGGGATLDSAYENGSDVVVDQGPVTWTDSTTGSANTMEFSKTGAGSGNIIDIDMAAGIATGAIFIDNGAGARTASDILVTDDSTGAHSVIDINSSGSGATIGFDWQESYNGSSSSFGAKYTMDNSDGIDSTAIQIVRGTGVRTSPAIDINDASTSSADLIDIDLTGIYTGNVIDFASGAAATGNFIFADMDSAIAMTALHIEGSGVRTEPFIELITDSTSSASLIDISVDGAITGQAAIDIDMNLGLAANAIYIDAGNVTRTANLLEFKDDGDGDVDAIAIVAANTGSGSVIDIDVTDIRTGNIIDIAMTGAATSTAVIAIDMNAAVAAAAIFLDAGNAIRTADLIDVTMDGSGDLGVLDINVTNTGAGDIIDIDITGVHTGNIIDIEVSAAAATGNLINLVTGTNLAGNAIAITTAGARLSPVIFIDGAGTDAGSDDHIIDINQSGLLNSNIIDITYSSSASDGNAIDINMGTNIAGSAIDIDTTGARSGPLINITSDATDAGTDDHTLFITQSGIQDSNMVQLVYDTAASTGDAVKVIMGTNLDGSALVITRTGVVTDDTIKIDSDQTGSTHQFDINLDGAGSGNVFDVTYGTAANTGNAIDLNMGTNVAGMAISIASAGTGAANEGNAIDVTHTGALITNADLVRIATTGSISSTSNVLSLNQSSGAGTAGANVLHIKASGTNVEALEVEEGKVYWAAQTITQSGNDETFTSVANILFVDPDGASRTGIIIAAGLRDADHIKIVNVADAAENMTFASAVTSNVAPGTDLVIGENEGVELVWHASTALWYPLVTVFT